MINTSVLGDDAIIFIVARGLRDWLLRGTPEAQGFFPAPHAVPSLRTVDVRTVFARMMVAPESAVPANPKAHQTAFEDVFLERSLRAPEELCPLELTLAAKKSYESCEPGKAECWMGCLELPDCAENDTFVCLNMNGEACCNEMDSPPPDPISGCKDMDPTCQWKCSA